MKEIRKYISEAMLGAVPIYAPKGNWSEPAGDKKYKALSGLESKIDRDINTYTARLRANPADEVAKAKLGELGKDKAWAQNRKSVISDKYGSGSPFSILGPNVAPIVGTISDTVSLINNLVTIGSMAAHSISRAAGWVKQIRSSMGAKTRKRQLDSIEDLAGSLIGYGVNSDVRNETILLSQLKRMSIIKERAIKDIFVIDIIKYASKANRPDLIEKYLEEIYPGQMNSTDIQKYMHRIEDTDFLEGERGAALSRIAKNRHDYNIDISPQ